MSDTFDRDLDADEALCLAARPQHDRMKGRIGLTAHDSASGEAMVSYDDGGCCAVVYDDLGMGCVGYDYAKLFAAAPAALPAYIAEVRRLRGMIGRCILDASGDIDVDATLKAAEESWCERMLIAEAEVERLRGAIAEHHAQKADDRCIEDDDRLYAAAGLPPCDRRVGDKAAMLKNCERFIDRRCEGGGWPSYAELEAERDALRAENEALRLECERRATCSEETRALMEAISDDLKSRQPTGVRAECKRLEAENARLKKLSVEPGEHALTYPEGYRLVVDAGGQVKAFTPAAGDFDGFAFATNVASLPYVLLCDWAAKCELNDRCTAQEAEIASLKARLQRAEQDLEAAHDQR